MSAEITESKIVYRDGEKERVIRGVVSGQDDFFITLERRDGVLKISKNCILRIEQWRDADE